MSEKRTVIAPVDAIPIGERKIYKVNNREIGIFNIDGAFFALRNACPHRGAPVCKGRLRPYIGPPTQADDIGGVTYEREDAVIWYESEREGYGDLFASEVRRAVARAAALPGSGVSVAGVPAEHDVRRFVLRRFPYSVITALIDGQRVVVAVAHGRRRPGYWRDRLEPT